MNIYSLIKAFVFTSVLCISLDSSAVYEDDLIRDYPWFCEVIELDKKFSTFSFSLVTSLENGMESIATLYNNPDLDKETRSACEALLKKGVESGINMQGAVRNLFQVGYSVPVRNIQLIVELGLAEYAPELTEKLKNKIERQIINGLNHEKLKIIFAILRKIDPEQVKKIYTEFVKPVYESSSYNHWHITLLCLLEATECGFEEDREFIGNFVQNNVANIAGEYVENADFRQRLAPFFDTNGLLSFAVDPDHPKSNDVASNLLGAGNEFLTEYQSIIIPYLPAILALHGCSPLGRLIRDDTPLTNQALVAMFEYFCNLARQTAFKRIDCMNLKDWLASFKSNKSNTGCLGAEFQSVCLKLFFVFAKYESSAAMCELLCFMQGDSEYYIVEREAVKYFGCLDGQASTLDDALINALKTQEDPYFKRAVNYIEIAIAHNKENHLFIKVFKEYKLSKLSNSDTTEIEEIAIFFDLLQMVYNPNIFDHVTLASKPILKSVIENSKIILNSTKSYFVIYKALNILLDIVEEHPELSLPLPIRNMVNNIYSKHMLEEGQRVINRRYNSPPYIKSADGTKLYAHKRDRGRLYLCCYDESNGRALWRCRFSNNHDNTVTWHYEHASLIGETNHYVFASCLGEMVCLNKTDGTEVSRWKLSDGMDALKFMVHPNDDIVDVLLGELYPALPSCSQASQINRYDCQGELLHQIPMHQEKGGAKFYYHKDSWFVEYYLPTSQLRVFNLDEPSHAPLISNAMRDLSDSDRCDSDIMIRNGVLYIHNKKSDTYQVIMNLEKKK
jgi:hypothetical protein